LGKRAQYRAKPGIAQPLHGMGGGTHARKHDALGAGNRGAVDSHVRTRAETLEREAYRREVRTSRVDDYNLRHEIKDPVPVARSAASRVARFTAHL
jgi:hypothetical protein